MASTVEPVKELASKYRHEFEDNYNALRRRSTDLQRQAQEQINNAQHMVAELEPTVKRTRDDVLSTLQNMEPIDLPTNNKLLDTFAWTAVMQAGCMLTTLIAGTLLYPLIGAVFNTAHAALLAYGLLPTLAFQHLRSSVAKDTDETTRFKLLGFAATEGLLVGFLLSNRYLISAQPLALLTPLSIAIVANVAGPQLGRQRPTILAALLGSGLAAHLLLATAIGQASFPAMLLSALYAGVGFCTLQFFFQYAAGDYQRSAHIFMYGYFVGALLCQALVFFLFAGAKESMDIAHDAREAAANAGHAAINAAGTAKHNAAEAAKAAKGYFSYK